ncbi:MAG: 50S ribosomal protein L2 [Candidatus Buchananbacteria bacterium CG10_big_fil_rev_8_21_14_0_10_42_9]|uniref:Large ribosomal subunit protein uL2 n=1 Tax=Candidatus Buchananbacteria bacterium CG10_big_fil_rev_8_21_14_0_10_42_9 TaxID=1974526 RepID=A0A2H0W240_9BACT|nr:MAG: 50S ribosomal protein L2 [Candidatus Buchananbacteria bacterium CG10_big_fil_rev_8_21_14_0_10_42_9]
MALKRYKPTTPARRHSSVVSSEDLTVKKPLKSLISNKKKFAGRNNTGKITVRHRGGGAKQFYRQIDFTRDKLDIPATVKTIEYDPNRNARIALISYVDGTKRYIIAPGELKVGQKIVTSKKRTEIAPGNRMPLEFIPQGMLVYNVELTPGRGAKIVRSAGSWAKLMAIEGKYAHLRLPSGEVRMVQKDCMATIGQVSNSDARLVRIGKAGRKRHMGIRPTVRGKVMNPVDHPHGGGEGSNPIGMKAPKTPWGKKALGVKTRKANKYSDKLIIKRRKRRKR